MVTMVAMTVVLELTFVREWDYGVVCAQLELREASLVRKRR